MMGQQRFSVEVNGIWIGNVRAESAEAAIVWGQNEPEFEALGLDSPHNWEAIPI